MSTFETYEGQEAFESFEGPYETGYEAYEGEDEQFIGNILGTIGRAVAPQLPAIASNIFGALAGEAESPLSEAQEMELTAELMEISSEAELEEFLGNLFKGVAKGVGGIIRSPVGQALGGALKGVAKAALPAVGGALGSMVAPGIGTAIGGQLGSMASSLFELETAGMTQEQAQFEVARRYVRLASSAARQAAVAPRNVPPARVVRVALTQAARQHAPGILRGTTAGAGGPRPQQPGRHPGAGMPRPSGRPLGAAAYPVGGSTVVVPGGNGGNGAPASQWGEPEPWASGDGGYDVYAQTGTRANSGRWVRRGRKIVLLGA